MRTYDWERAEAFAMTEQEKEDVADSKNRVDWMDYYLAQGDRTQALIYAITSAERKKARLATPESAQVVAQPESVSVPDTNAVELTEPASAVHEAAAALVEGVFSQAFQEIAADEMKGTAPQVQEPHEVAAAADKSEAAPMGEPVREATSPTRTPFQDALDAQEVQGGKRKASRPSMISRMGSAARATLSFRRMNTKSGGVPSKESASKSANTDSDVVLLVHRGGVVTT